MEPYQSNSVMTNLSFANENSSHVLFCNAQNSVENHLGKELHYSGKELHHLDKELHHLDEELHHLDKELHHLGKELHRFGVLKVREFQKWKKVPLKIFLIRFV